MIVEEHANDSPIETGQDLDHNGPDFPASFRRTKGIHQILILSQPYKRSYVTVPVTAHHPGEERIVGLFVGEAVRLGRGREDRDPPDGGVLAHWADDVLADRPKKNICKGGQRKGVIDPSLTDRFDLAKDHIRGTPGPAILISFPGSYTQ